MAPPRGSTAPDPAQKQQRMISSFFAVKSSPRDSATPPSPSSPANGTRLDISQSSRPAEQTPTPRTNGARAGGDDCDGRASKKRKISQEADPYIAQDANADLPADQEQLPTFPRNAVTEPHSSLDRALRYAFHPEHSGTVEGGEWPEEDQATILRKRSLHQKFLQKLGDPERFAALKRRASHAQEQDPAEAAEFEDEQELADELPAKASSRGRKKNTGHTLTPMEKQIIDIKGKHSDTILVVEVGYKFRFFGEDARVAAKELGVVCIPGKLKVDGNFAPGEDRFASASFPTHRLHVHVKRLVAAGHKVGIVRQLETAALKAAGANRNAPFVRKLTNLYTKGTYVDDVDQIEGPDSGPASGASNSGHILCLTESKAKGWGNDEKVQVGIVAVQPATGDIIYDDFEDGFMRGEIETRLLHIAPSEFVIVGQVSKPTDRLIKHLSASKSNVFRDSARVERMEKPKTAAAQSASHISKFYAGKLRDAGDPQSAQYATILDKAHCLSEHTSICLSAMITHLSEFGLEHVFDLTKNFQAFSTRSHMLLNGNTLTSLEIYRNQTDHGERGSLVWVLDHTLTKNGKRMLRKWVGRPLLDKTKLQERIDAVEELNDVSKSAEAEKLRLLLAKIRTDMEKSLIRIYYGKCSRPELLSTLQTLQMVASEYAYVKSPGMAGFSATVLGEAIACLPQILEAVISYLDKINPEAARNDEKESFFRDEHATDTIANHKAGLRAIEDDLDAHRQAVAAKLKKRSVEYVTVAGIDFLIEVDNANLRSVPASWSKISGTKKMSRFHTPDIVKMLRERDQHQEALAAACDEAFKALLSDISAKYESLRDCIQAVATLDCLLSLATVAARPDYCKPEFSESPEIRVEAGRHPMVEQLLLSSYVANDISLTPEGCRALLITGPNMGGKSSYVRQVALISIMGQIGSYVPASSAKLGMLDAVFTRMGAFDNMLAGESTFMVELHETADMLKQAGPRSLMILDELGRGTSTHDGVAIAHAVLEHVIRETKGLLLFITHYQSLSTVADGLGIAGLKNVHMKFTEDNDEDGEGNVTFLYEVGEGTAHRSYGLNVARLANLPQDVLQLASCKSTELEAFVSIAKVTAAVQSMRRLLINEEVDVGTVISSLEQL